MEASADVTSSVPGGKGPQVLTMLKRLLDTALVPVLAVFTALVIGGIIIIVTDAAVYAAFREGGLGDGLAAAWQSVMLAYGSLLSGSLGDANAISESLVASTPFIFAGLAVAFGFRGGLFNIGAEGQLLVAAGAAVMIGSKLQLPAIIHLPLALVGGTLVGAIYGAIPGYLKAKTGGHEVINTIMMNWVAILFFKWAFTGPLRRAGGDAPVTDEIYPSAYLPQLFEGHRLHLGVVLALVVAFIGWWILFKTTLGFEIIAVGANLYAVRYGGITIGRTIVVPMAVIGGVVGLARTDLERAAESCATRQGAAAPRGVVAVCALPARLAFAALDAVESEGPGAKISRGEVWRISADLDAALDAGAPAVAQPSSASAAATS